MKTITDTNSGFYTDSIDPDTLCTTCGYYAESDPTGTHWTHLDWHPYDEDTTPCNRVTPLLCAACEDTPMASEIYNICQDCQDNAPHNYDRYDAYKAQA